MQAGTKPDCSYTGIYTNGGNRDDEISLSTCLDLTGTTTLTENNQVIFSGSQKEMVRWCGNNRDACRRQLQQERKIVQEDAADYGIGTQCKTTVYNQGRSLLADNQPKRFLFIALISGGTAIYGVGSWALGLPTDIVATTTLPVVGALYAIFQGSIEQVTNYSLNDIGSESIAGAIGASIAMRQWFYRQFNGRQLNQCPSSAAVQNLMELGQLYQD